MNSLTLEKLQFPIGKCPKIDDVSASDLKTWIASIEEFPSKIKALTSNLSSEKLNWIYRPKGWSIKQVVHHCADSHMNCFIRIKWTLTENNPIIKFYYENLWSDGIDNKTMTIEPTLQFLKGLHYQYIQKY